MIIVIGEWERDKGHFCWLMNCINNWMRYLNPVVKPKSSCWMRILSRCDVDVRAEKEAAAAVAAVTAVELALR